MSTSAINIVYVKLHILNSVMGIRALYLVATAWFAARRKSRETRIFDQGALLVPLAVGVTLIAFGVAVAGRLVLKHGYPAAVYLVFGSMALVFASGDVSMLIPVRLFCAH